MNDKTMLLLAELLEHSKDPATFARLRQKILQSHFESVRPSALPNLLAFQDQIETSNAIAGTPMRALRSLMDDLANQCNVLEHAHDQLRNEFLDA